LDTIPCENCGAPLTAAVRFCPKCGRGVTRDGVTPKPLAATRPARRVGPGVIQCGTCGTQTVPGVSFCFECGAPIHDTAQPEASFRMQEDDSPAKPRKMATWMKVLIGVGVLFMCTVGACVACVVGLARHAPQLEVSGAEQYQHMVPPELAALMPPDEAAFCQTISRYAKNVSSDGSSQPAPAEVTRLLKERTEALQQAGSARRFSEWIGVAVLKFMQDKKANVTVQLPCEARLVAGLDAAPKEEIPTRGNAVTTSAGPQLEELVQIGRGDTVKLSGSFVTAADGSYFMSEVTDAAKLAVPAFFVHLAAIHPAQGAAEPGAQPKRSLPPPP
jgi:hypothetical protein